MVTSAEVGAAKPDPRPFLQGLALAGAAPEEAVHVGDSPENDVAGARAAGVRPLLVARGRRRPPRSRSSDRLARCPPYSPECHGAVRASPATTRAGRSSPTGSPRAGRPGTRPWRFLVALVGTLIAVGIVAVITGATSDEGNPTFTVVATFIQAVVFIGTAVLFASFTRRPQPWHFGLRRAPFWPSVGWAALGMLCFYVFAAAYTALVQPDAEQTVAQDLGADEGTFGLIAAGFMVVCVAPVAEEIFFRGFFYRALRSRFSILVAALINGALFGVIHFDFSSSDALLILPPLAALGFMFCLVYEKTGSLYPVIALHAFNNALAFGIQAEGWEVSAVLGPLMLVACVLVPRLTRPAPALR